MTPGVQGNVHRKLELNVQDGTVTMTISFSCLRRTRAHFRREGQGLAEGLLSNEKGADTLSQSLPPVHGRCSGYRFARLSASHTQVGSSSSELGRDTDLGQ